MRWLQTEYLLKGIYLGLVLYAALQLAAIPAADAARAWEGLAWVNLLTLLGLALGLLIAGLAKLREGFRVRGRLLPFVFFLLLESPTLAYLGILAGAVAGMYQVRNILAAHYPEAEQTLQGLLFPTLGGAAAAGLVFGILRQVRHRLMRLGLILALGAAVVVTALSWLGSPNLALFGKIGKPYHLENGTLFAVQLLLGIPFFFLLTFAGHEEESEVEVGAVCVTLGVGLAVLLRDSVQFSALAFVLPILFYFAYTMRVLPGLRVLKHAFRGYSYTRVGRHRRALQAFRRALQLDPNNRLAREGFWEVHRSLDLQTLAGDTQTLALVDLDLCLDRAGSLLVHGTPTPAQLAEAHRLLDLVLSLARERRPPVDYWRAVAHTHARKYDEAAAALERLLDPLHYGPENPHRLAVLLPAWLLALTLHDELRRRVGEPQLGLPGRRMEAIAAVERHLAEQPDDQNAFGLKRLLYQDVTEAEYNQAVAQGAAAPHFDHAYVQQLGLALIDDNARWQRGGEYLRMAAHGLPTLGPTIFVQIAQAHQRAGHLDEARHNYELAKRAGKGVGHKNLAEAERQAYFSTLKLLGEDAMARDDLDAAIENFHLYSESERSGLETLRTLAELYERKGDALSALRATDQALVYNAKDKDLLARKDRYYYSVMPEQLQARLEQVRAGFDFDYCLRKSRGILEGKLNDFEWLDVAHHLARLALVVRPDSLAAKVLLARAQLRFGERDQALALLEQVRSPKPEKFASGEDEEAWFIGSSLLGDLYMELGRADLAVPCYVDFRKSSKSGAKTLFKLGQAYEQLGDRARAARCYQQVTAYEGNPLTPEAHDALQRLQG
jgi:tetratricopeptide (TPR) repeat protein